MNIVIFLIFIVYCTFSYSMEFGLEFRMLRNLQMQEIEQLEKIKYTIKQIYQQNLNGATNIAYDFIESGDPQQFNQYLKYYHTLKALTHVKEDITSILQNPTTFDNSDQFKLKIHAYMNKVYKISAGNILVNERNPNI